MSFLPPKNGNGKFLPTIKMLTGGWFSMIVPCFSNFVVFLFRLNKEPCFFTMRIHHFVACVERLVGSSSAEPGE
jgi:hypothetical protein